MSPATPAQRVRTVLGAVAKRCEGAAAAGEEALLAPEEAELVAVALRLALARVCRCGHVATAHDDRTGPCQGGACPCPAFEVDP